LLIPGGSLARERIVLEHLPTVHAPGLPDGDDAMAGRAFEGFFYGYFSIQATVAKIYLVDEIFEVVVGVAVSALEQHPQGLGDHQQALDVLLHKRDLRGGVLGLRARLGSRLGGIRQVWVEEVERS
jgi:hypothetical protein